jgi:hypothetical protein
MSKLAQLREQRSAVAKKAHDLNAKYPADQRMPVAEASQLDQLLGEITAIDAESTASSAWRISPATTRNQHDQAMDAAYRPAAASRRKRAACHAGRRPVGAECRAALRHEWPFEP